MSISDTLINRIFDGRYRVVRKLGTGGMANVYLAEDQELGRRVAIKLLDERHAQDDQFVERFRREAKNAAGLSHPNIVSIYDRGEAEGTYYIAMEYLEGKTLKELILQRGPTPIPVAIDYAQQILAALSFAHRNGIVHRDIKPHNVVVAPDGRLKVTDFGIARSGTSQMTEAGSIIGTAQYLSPEQARGAPVSPASDLYSVGIVLYEMLTGTVPFSGETPLEVAMKHLSAVPEPPSAKRPGVPEALDKIVLRALAKRPEDRYASAEEMAADLARVVKGLPVSSATEEAATIVLSGEDAMSLEPTVVVPGRRRAAGAGARGQRRGPPAGYYELEEPVRRRPLWPWLLALLLLAAAGIASFYVYSRIQDQLAEAKPVTVPFVEGKIERLAVRDITSRGLRPRVRRVPNEKVPVGQVFDQDPPGGNKVEKGNTVVILVSTGKPKVTVPDVVGERVTDAVAEIVAAKLAANVVEIHSDKEPGTVTAQNPRPGAKVVAGERVRINVSKGLAPLEVPSVIGRPFDEAEAIVRGAGFSPARVDVDSSAPEGKVVGMDPGPGTLQPRGSTVTLQVSRGPQTMEVPDVTQLDRATARAALRSAGFKVSVETLETSDPALDGVVISQSPSGGSQAEPGARVTITVGKYVEPPPPPPTDTVPTDTIPVEPPPAPPPVP